MSQEEAAAELELHDSLPSEDMGAIEAGLRAFNEPFLGPADHRPLAVVARLNGKLAGGLVGETSRGFLCVDLLWVEDGSRGTGLGSRLLAAAEAEATARGCRHAWLGTYDFQAQAFYEARGYRSFGTLEGYPGGHRSIFLTKRLPG